jgi:hypothetical protein
MPFGAVAWAVCSFDLSAEWICMAAPGVRSVCGVGEAFERLTAVLAAGGLLGCLVDRLWFMRIKLVARADRKPIAFSDFSANRRQKSNFATGRDDTPKGR